MKAAKGKRKAAILKEPESKWEAAAWELEGPAANWSTDGWKSTSQTSSSRTVTSLVNLRLINTKLAALRLIEVTPGEVERHLQSLAGELAPNSLNHLRAYLSAAFGKAKRAAAGLARIRPVKSSGARSRSGSLTF